MSDVSARPQVWACTVAPGKTIRLQDLPIVDWVELGSKLTMEWTEFYFAPLRHAAAGLAIYEKCCAAAGVTPTANISAKDLLDAFELVDDDVPYSFTDGLPDPTQGDASTTDG